MRTILIIKTVVITTLLLLTFGLASKGQERPNYVISEMNNNNKQKTLIVFVTGDGGYNGFSKKLLGYFSIEGYARLIFDSKKYFWEKRTPEITSRDFEKSILAFLEKSGCKDIYIIGHSFSAGILPFVISNFSAHLRSKIRHVTYLSPDEYASPEVTLSTMLNWKQKPNEYKVLPEILKVKYIPSTYVFCKNGEEHLVEMYRKSGLKVEVLDGPHNYNRDFPAIYNVIRLNR